MEKQYSITDLNGNSCGKKSFRIEDLNGERNKETAYNINNLNGVTFDPDRKYGLLNMCGVSF